MGDFEKRIKKEAADLERQIFHPAEDPFGLEEKDMQENFYSKIKAHDVFKKRNMELKESLLAGADDLIKQLDDHMLATPPFTRSVEMQTLYERLTKIRAVLYLGDMSDFAKNYKREGAIPWHRPGIVKFYDMPGHNFVDPPLNQKEQIDLYTLSIRWTRKFRKQLKDIKRYNTLTDAEKKKLDKKLSMKNRIELQKKLKESPRLRFYSEYGEDSIELIYPDEPKDEEKPSHYYLSSTDVDFGKIGSKGEYVFIISLDYVVLTERGSYEPVKRSPNAPAIIVIDAKKPGTLLRLYKILEEIEKEAQGVVKEREAKAKAKTRQKRK